MTEARSHLWDKVKRWLPGVLISLVALYLVFQLANINDLQTAFTTISPIFIAASVLITIVFCITRSFAWRILLDNKPTVGQTFFAINTGYLLNNLFPFRAGEIGRAVLLGQTTGLGTFHVIINDHYRAGF